MIVCGDSVLVFVLVCTPLYFCNHHDEEERAGCFAFLCLVTVNVLYLFLMVTWVGLLCDCGIS